MPILALMQDDVRLEVRAGAIVVRQNDVEVQVLQPHEVTEIQVHGGAHISAAMRRLLLREGIDVVFLSRNGRYEGRLTSTTSRIGARRIAQYRLAADPARALAMAREIVASKVDNQRTLLQARQAFLKKEEIGDALAAMRSSLARTRLATDLDSLRGLEGMAARHYFQGFGACITNTLFTFTGRNRRPPRDPVNACLSFGYALLLSQVEAALLAASVDPFVGCLHSALRGAPALALDLTEEFRPWVDGTVLTLVNRRQISPEDFRRPEPEVGSEPKEGEESAPVQAVLLGTVGRSILLRAWESRLDDRFPHPIRGDQWSLRALIREQAQQAARVFEGEAEGWKPAKFGG